MSIEIKIGATDSMHFDNSAQPITPTSGVLIYSNSDNLYSLNNSGNPSILSGLSAATFILKTSFSGLDNAVALSGMGSGLLKNESGTGNLSIANAGTDYYSAEMPIVLSKGGGGNIFIMNSTGELPASLSGNFIVCVGESTGKALTSGMQNSFFGNACAFLATTVSASTFMGFASANNLLTGDENTFLGCFSGTGVTNSTQCTFIGKSSTSSTASGLTNSTAIGYSTLVNTNNSVNIGSSCNVGLNNNSPAYNLDIKAISGVCGVAVDTSSLPSTPASGRAVLYYDGTNFKFVNSAGTVKTFIVA